MIKPRDLIEKFKKALQEKWGYILGMAGELWTEAKQASIERTTDEDRAQAREYGRKWIGHIVADCSGLFTWAFRQLGGKMYHGSDTMFRKWCTDKGELVKGKRSDGKTLKPGTAVFVWNSKKQKYSHVGLYVGDSTVIEAMGTINGVTTTKVTNKKWTHWGELKGVDYGVIDDQPVTELPPTTDQTVKLPTLRRGSKGTYVTLLQTQLVNKGYNIGSYGIDGDFGKSTEAAVKKFQSDNGLVADGVVGTKTWEALEKIQVSNPEPKYTVKIMHLTKEQANDLMMDYKDATMIQE